MTSACGASCLRAPPAGFRANALSGSPLIAGADLAAARSGSGRSPANPGELSQIEKRCPGRGRTRAVRSSTHVEGCGHRSVPAVADGRLRRAGERAISCRNHYHGKACLEHALLGRRSRRSGSPPEIIVTRCRSDAREAMRGQVSLPWRRGPHLRPRWRHSPLSVKFRYPTASPGQRHSARSPRGS